MVSLSEGERVKLSEGSGTLILMNATTGKDYISVKPETKWVTSHSIWTFARKYFVSSMLQLPKCRCLKPLGLPLVHDTDPPHRRVGWPGNSGLSPCNRNQHWARMCWRDFSCLERLTVMDTGDISDSVSVHTWGYTVCCVGDASGIMDDTWLLFYQSVPKLFVGPAQLRLCQRYDSLLYTRIFHSFFSHHILLYPFCSRLFRWPDQNLFMYLLMYPGWDLNLFCHVASYPAAHHSCLLDGNPQIFYQDHFITQITANNWTLSLASIVQKWRKLQVLGSGTPKWQHWPLG